MNKTKNNLPKYWAVKNDGSQLFKDTVIEYMNTIFTGSPKWGGHINDVYYGFDGNDKCNGTGYASELKYLENNPTLLRLTEFINLTNPTQMNQPTKEQILEAAKTSCEIKEALKKMYPEAFDDEITTENLKHIQNSFSIRASGEYREKALYLSSLFDYEVKKDSFGSWILIPTKK